MRVAGGRLVPRLHPQLRPERRRSTRRCSIEAAGVLRGSGYVAFAGDAPKDPVHAALASTYAHTTAPLRRLVDRYVGEACVALSAGEEHPGLGARGAPDAPRGDGRSRPAASSQYESGIVSTVEAALLEDSVGDTFDGDRRRPERAPRRRHGRTSPSRPVTARCDGDDLPLGERVEVRLELADVMKRQVRFRLA